MEYCTFNNGVKMPMLGFGTFLNNGSVCEKSVAEAIEDRHSRGLRQRK